MLAFALPLVAAVLWGLLLAPRAARRLRHPARLIVKVVLLAAAAAALAVSGEVLSAIGFLVVTAAFTIAGELRAARGDSPTASRVGKSRHRVRELDAGVFHEPMAASFATRQRSRPCCRRRVPG